MTTGEDNIYMT